MKEIKTVGIIGLGALGVLYAQQFTKAHANLPRITKIKLYHTFWGFATCFARINRNRHFLPPRQAPWPWPALRCGRYPADRHPDG